MKLILLRHGDRSPGFNDVPLSNKGLQQALDLQQKKSLSLIEVLYCSPKKRAQQTLAPLAQKLALPIETLSELDQMRDIETPQDFIQRVQKFIDSLPKTTSTTWLVCSHSDWLQQAVFLLANDTQLFAPYSFFSCAEFKTFAYIENEWRYQDGFDE